jgi:3-oxoacyl-[acyl-carrier-protein] synthase-3
MKTPDVYINATGTHLPEITPISWAVEQGLLDRETADRYGVTGVPLAGDLPAPEMAVRASREALARSGQDPARLSLLLYVSTWYQGPHGWCPQFYVQRHTGSGQASALEVRQACMGVFGAFEVAATHLMASPEHEAVLITASDNFEGELMNRWQSSPHALVGDGACALVLSRRPGPVRVLSVNSVTFPEFEDRHRGTKPLFPPDAELRTTMDLGQAKRQWKGASEVVGAIGATMAVGQRDLVNKTLAEAGWQMADVARVVFVNLSRERVEERAAVPLGVPMSMLTWDYGSTVGHVAASDQILSLDHLLVTKQVAAGDRLLLLGTGPGATIAAIAVEVTAVPDWNCSGTSDQ